MFTTSDADLGADLDPDHRLLLRFVHNALFYQCRVLLLQLFLWFCSCSVSQLCNGGEGGRREKAIPIGEIGLLVVGCLSGAGTRRVLHRVWKYLDLHRTCCFCFGRCWTRSAVQVFAAFAQVAQQWCCVGGVHSALLLQLANRKHHEPNSQGDGAHPEKSQRDPVRGAGRHQVRNYFMLPCPVFVAS